MLQLDGQRFLDIIEFASGKDTQEQFARRYATLLYSIVDSRYVWFYTEMVQSKQIKTCLVDQSSFELLMTLIKTSCLELRIDEATVNQLIELLTQNKEKLVSSKNEWSFDRGNQSLMQSLEEQDQTNSLIERFFLKMQDLGIFNDFDEEASELMHQDFVMRISKILLSKDLDALSLDQQRIEKMASMPVNSSDPIYIAAEVFKETLIEERVDEAMAQVVKQAFFAL